MVGCDCLRNVLSLEGVHTHISIGLVCAAFINDLWHNFSVKKTVFPSISSFGCQEDVYGIASVGKNEA